MFTCPTSVFALAEKRKIRKSHSFSPGGVVKTLLCIAPLGRYDYDNFRPAFTKMYNHMRTYILFIHISTCSNVHTPECLIFSCDQAALQMVFSVCLSVRPSLRLSVCPSHLFDYVPIIGSSWNFQELLPMTNVRSMQKVKVRGQRSRSQRSQPILTVSGL